MERKKFEDLNVLDNFMFNELMSGQDPKDSENFARITLETILQKKVRNLKIIPQKMVQGVTNEKHGIVLDTYVEAVVDEDGNECLDVEIQPEIFDIEPNTYESDSEEKRFRYYHALIDTKLLDTGVKYKELKNVTLIMISNYDPFGKNLMWYTIQNHCVEEPDMPYDDGVKTIYLYTKGKKNIPSKALADMLRYMQTSISENVVNQDIQQISDMMDFIKQDSEKGIRFMKSWEIEMLAEERGEKRGIAKGEAIGRAEGEVIGIAKGEETEKIRTSNLFKLLNASGRMDDFARAMNDPEYLVVLYKEFHLDE